jgi:DNA-binding transcriptional regulator GbsR (MarR family)
MEEDTLRTYRSSVSEIAEALGKSISLVNQAMFQLQDAGLVAEQSGEDEIL